MKQTHNSLTGCFVCVNAFFKQKGQFCEESVKCDTGRRTINVQMKHCQIGRQPEFISVVSRGDCEMKPASVCPHRKGFRIIHTVSLIIMLNRRCHGILEQLGPMGVHAYFKDGSMERKTHW